MMTSQDFSSFQALSFSSYTSPNSSASPLKQAEKVKNFIIKKESKSRRKESKKEEKKKDVRYPNKKPTKWTPPSPKPKVGAFGTCLADHQSNLLFLQTRPSICLHDIPLDYSKEPFSAFAMPLPPSLHMNRLRTRFH